MSAEHVLPYVPLTGPVPDGLQPGQAFVHKRVKVGPGVAAALLANRSPLCRPISLLYVDRYADDMTRGEWKYGACEISINDHGELIDGCRVLSAVVKSKCEIEVDVSYNVSPFSIPMRRRNVSGEGVSFADHYASVMARGSDEIGFLDPEEPVTLAPEFDADAGQRRLGEWVREQREGSSGDVSPQ